LHEVRRKKESELSDCSRTRRNLRQVQRSYARGTGPAWTSYS
jgi:hypothetical protein